MVSLSFFKSIIPDTDFLFWSNAFWKVNALFKYAFDFVVEQFFSVSVHRQTVSVANFLNYNQDNFKLDSIIFSDY